MVNALCDDIVHSRDPIARLQAFLSWCRFPLAGAEPVFKGIKNATFHVEQSFSDYGDLDLLILLDYPDGRKQAILAEAKVSTDTGNPESIGDRWDDLGSFLGGDSRKTSSLFVQLYRKMKLIRQVENLNQVLPPDAVARRWSLGNNRVVRQAAARLAAYRLDPWYLAIIPDGQEEAEAFFVDRLGNYTPVPNELPAWSGKRLGYVSWPRIYEETHQHHDAWPQLMRNYRWNQHQIYPIPQQPVGAIPHQGFRFHGHEVVYVAVPSANNCRVVPTVNLGGYFPQSFLVTTRNLGGPAEPQPPVNPADLRPTAGNIHNWNPPLDEDPRPRRRPPVPVPAFDVMIRNAGWETSAVTQVIHVDGEYREFGDPFFVYNHHLLTLVIPPN